MHYSLNFHSIFYPIKRRKVTVSNSKGLHAINWRQLQGLSVCLLNFTSKLRSSPRLVIVCFDRNLLKLQTWYSVRRPWGCIGWRGMKCYGRWLDAGNRVGNPFVAQKKKHYIMKEKENWKQKLKNWQKTGQVCVGLRHKVIRTIN